MFETEKKRPVTSEEWSDHLVSLAAEAQFGMPEHSAVSDYLNLQELYSNFGKEPQSQLARANGEANLPAESRVRVTELKLALLEHTIEQNRARIPGYSDAYVEISTGFEDLVGAAVKEAKARFSDEEKQIAYVAEVHVRTIDNMNFEVFRTQTPNL